MIHRSKERIRTREPDSSSNPLLNHIKIEDSYQDVLQYVDTSLHYRGDLLQHPACYSASPQR